MCVHRNSHVLAFNKHIFIALCLIFGLLDCILFVNKSKLKGIAEFSENQVFRFIRRNHKNTASILIWLDYDAEKSSKSF